MDHVTEDMLLAYLDGELAEGDRAAVSGHLAECETCAADLTALRAATARLSEALRRSDLPAPAGAVLLPRGVRTARKGSTPLRRALARAAILVLAVTGAAAAVPGSPVRDWLVRSVGELVAAFRGEPAAPVPLPPQAEFEHPGAPATSGVAVPVDEGDVLIRLTNPAPDAVVRVRLVEGDRAAVWSQEGQYRTGPGRIEVVGAGPGELRVEIPTAARAARVEIDGRLVVLKEGSNLRLFTPAVDSAGAEVLFRAGRG